MTVEHISLRVSRQEKFRKLGNNISELQIRGNVIGWQETGGNTAEIRNLDCQVFLIGRASYESAS